MMKNVMELVQPPVDLNEHVYVVMLIQSCDNFFMKYQTNIPPSNYNQLV